MFTNVEVVQHVVGTDLVTQKKTVDSFQGDKSLNDT